MIVPLRFLVPSRPWWVLVLAGVVWMLAWPSASVASRAIGGTDCDKYGNCQDSLAFVGSGAQLNDVSVAPQPSSAVYPTGGYRVSDTGGPLRAVGSCRSVDAHTAVCVPGQGGTPTRLSVSLSDNNDRLDTHALSLPTDVRAGRGHDVVITGSGSDTLFLKTGHAVFDGGPGKNTVIFHRPFEPVRVDLASGRPQGNAQAQVSLRNVQGVDVSRGKGHDTLLGSPRASYLSAGPHSLVVGRSTGDELYAGPGSRVIAGPGHANMSGTADPFGRGPLSPRSTFICGPGQDEANAVLVQDLVLGPCARIGPEIGLGFWYYGLMPRPAPGRPFIKLVYGCESSDCRPTVVARLGSTRGPLLAYRHLHFPPFNAKRGFVTRRYAIRLLPGAQALLRRRKHLHVVVYGHEAPYRNSSGHLIHPGLTGFATIISSP